MSKNAIAINDIYFKVQSILKGMLESQQEIEWDDNLIEKGLNSLTSIRLVVKLEEEFEIEFDDSELVFENFSMIRTIVTRIQSKIGIKDN